MEEKANSSCGTCGSWWRLPLFLVPVLVVVLLLGRAREAGEPTEPKVEAPAGQSAVDVGEAVSLAIEFGDSRREYGSIAWREGMTVRDALVAAGDRPAGTKFAEQGSGESAFLTEIDSVRNEGAGGRNWTFAVNGEFADRSFAIYPLQAGDKVLWTFGEQK
jgi:hypothetical protein